MEKGIATAESLACTLSQTSRRLSTTLWCYLNLELLPCLYKFPSYWLAGGRYMGIEAVQRSTSLFWHCTCAFDRLKSSSSTRLRWWLFFFVFNPGNQLILKIEGDQVLAHRIEWWNRNYTIVRHPYCNCSTTLIEFLNRIQNNLSTDSPKHWQKLCWILEICWKCSTQILIQRTRIRQHAVNVKHHSFCSSVHRFTIFSRGSSGSAK